MKTSSAKAKGRKLQQWARDRIRAVFHLKDDDVTSRSMGAQGTDVLLSPAAKLVFPFALECKCQEKVSIWEAWHQTKENAGTEYPLLIIKRNGEEPLAILDAQLFFMMAGQIK